MQTCFLHPLAEASVRCEYCTQPHCSACQTLFLGRYYCPACLQQVRAMAGCSPAAVDQSPAGLGLGVGAPRPQGPRLHGLLSAALYLIGLVLLLAVSGFGLQVAMVLARAVGGTAVPERGAILDPSGLGLGLWSTIMAGWAWVELALVLLFTAGLAVGLERRGLLSLGLKPRGTFWRDALVGPALAAVLFISVVGVGAGKGWYAVSSQASAVDALGITLVSLLILLPLAAVEEIAVRGYLLQTLGRSVGKWGGLLLSSLVFALLHAQNDHFGRQPLATLGIFLAGLYLGSAYLITGNLWLAIFVHAAWNLMEGPVFGLPVSGNPVPTSVFQTSATGPALWTGAGFGPEAGLLLCLLMAVHLAALWAMRPLLAGKPDPEPRLEEGVAIARPVGSGALTPR